MTQEKFVFDLDPGDTYRPGLPALLETTKNLIRIGRGEQEPDERDALYFGRVYEPGKLIGERISLDADKSIRGAMRRVNMRRNLSPLGPNQFGGLVEKFITSHQLSMPLEETNPLHVLEQNRRITQMGPGGIPSEDSVTEEAAAIHPSIFGFLSAWEGPESSTAGVDTRLATGTKLGSDGSIYQKWKDRRSGKMVWLNASDMAGKTYTVAY